MHLSFLLISLFVFSSCGTTPDISSLDKKVSTDKILTNKSDAQNAKSEYRALQKQREAQ